MMLRTIRNNWFGLLVGLVAIVMIVVLFSRQPAVPPGQSQPTPGQMMTIDPKVIDNLTALPKATPLAGQDANDLISLKTLVDACKDYTAARLTQMDEQIGFIINPAALSPDVILALGQNPSEQLLIAIGDVTANQWQLNSKPTGSCLIPIGKRINQMIIADGGTPNPVFN